jgi:hypothetical protein
MICDFCREEFSHKPYVITKTIITDGSKGIKLEFNFCSRTCLIAEKIFAELQRIADDNESVLQRDELFSTIKNNVMQLSGCTEYEYKEGLKRFNKCCVVLDDDEIEKYL